MGARSLECHGQTAAFIAADAAGFAKLRAVRPAWVAVRRLAEAIHVNSDRYVLHAGPPYWDHTQIPQPVRNSICAACIFENWADDRAEAEALMASGSVTVAAAQDHRAVVPLAGVLSPSMTIIEVADLDSPSTRCFAALNEGQHHATRFGIEDERLPGHLSWLSTRLSPWLQGALGEPIELLPVIASSLAGGDECHASTAHGSRVISSLLRERASCPSEVDTFLDTSPAFALNLWMAAAALMLRSAEATSDCTLITRSGGNGETFGIQLAGLPGSWITMPAPVPVGRIEATAQGQRALGAVGDSALLDFLGLGAQALAAAPEVAKGLSGHLPDNAHERSEMILAGIHPALGRQAATSAARAVAAGLGPLVLLGMIDRDGISGRIGGGVVDVSVQLFASALKRMVAS